MVIGEQRSKTFFAKKNDEVLTVSDLIASLYEIKSGKEIQRFDSEGVNPEVEDLGNGYFKITATPDITRKFQHGVEIWLDVCVGSEMRIFRGKFGIFYKSTLSNVL